MVTGLQGNRCQALPQKALASERAHNRESHPIPMAQLVDDVVLDASAGVHRPRNLDWKRAAALLYGDWGTSKAYVIGLAFVAAGFSSLPIILAVCARDRAGRHQLHCYLPSFP